MRALTATALLVAASFSATATAQRVSEPIPAIVVSGSGETRVDPDLATVRLGIQAQAKTAQEAQAQASATAQRIIDAVLKAGVDRKEIQTGNLSLFPVFSEVKPGQTTAPQIVAYRAVNTLTIRVLDLKKVGAVVDSTVAAGANEIQGVEFGLRNDQAARREALKAAVREARAKAEAIAEALGVKLGFILEANEGGVQVMPVQMARADFAAAPLAAPAEPGQVGVNASVTIRFQIIQNP